MEKNLIRIFCGFNIFFIIYTLYSIFFIHIFPNIFFFIKFDYFMDFFNINWWSLRNDFYTVFKGLYTPLNLFISKIFSFNCINLVTPVEMRSCGIYNYLFIFSLLYIFNIFILFKNKYNFENKALWIIFFSTSFPILYTFERGNYILFAYTFINIYLFLLSNDSKYRYFVLLLACSFKIYLLILINLRNISKNFVCSLILLIFISIFIIYFYEFKNPFSLFDNIISFQNKGLDSNQKNYQSTALLSIIFKIKLLEFPFFVILIISYILYFIYIILLFIFSYLLFKSLFILKFESLETSLLILIAFTLLTGSIGYYALILLIPYFIYMLSNNKLNKLQKFLIVLIFIPFPFEIKEIFTMKDINLNGELIYSNYSIYLGFLTPLFISILFFTIFYRGHSLKRAFAHSGNKTR